LKTFSILILHIQEKEDGMERLDYIETKFEEPLEETVLGRVTLIYEEVTNPDKSEPNTIRIALVYPANYTSIEIKSISLFKKLAAFLSNVADALD